MTMNHDSEPPLSEAPQVDRMVDLRQAVQEQKRSTYREAILDAAERLIVRDGFQSVHVSDVASATGVAVGTLYRYFPSKDALFHAIAIRHRERYFELLTEPFDSTDPLKQLETLVDRSLEFVEQHGSLFAIYVKSASCPLSDPEGLPSLDPTEDHRKYREVFEARLRAAAQTGLLRGDLSIEELAWSLNALLHAAFVEWSNQTTPGALLARGRAIFSLFVKGARSS